MNIETKCPNIGCNRHLGFGLNKTGSVVYCKGCSHYTHFKSDGSKRLYHKEFLPNNLKRSFQDKLQNNLVKK